MGVCDGGRVREGEGGGGSHFVLKERLFEKVRFSNSPTLFFLFNSSALQTSVASASLIATLEMVSPRYQPL